MPEDVTDQKSVPTAGTQPPSSVCAQQGSSFRLNLQEGALGHAFTTYGGMSMFHHAVAAQYRTPSTK
ncbi:MAG: hypothetical protein OXU20_22225 [Myxococcales bacterium]|nr:hypothetical protein [Myxococcales bacterium]